MATLSKLEVGVHLFPLLHGEIDISRFVLTDPVIHLEVDKTGKPNWEFAPSESEKAKPGAKEAASNGGGSLDQLQLGEVKLVNGTVDYFDARSNVKYAASQIGVTVSLPSLDEKSAIDGSITYQGKPIKLSLVASKPRALMGPGDSTLKVGISSDLFAFAFDGNVTGGTPSKLEGTLSVEAGSVRDVANFAGSAPPIGGTGLGTFSLKGKVVNTGASVSFSDIALVLDSLKANGNLAIDANGAVPVIKGALNVGMLDLNPYLAAPPSAPPPGAPAQQGAPAAAPPAAPSAGWSDAPLDFSPLKSIGVDLTIAADGVKYQKIEIGKSALAIAIHDGKLTLGLTELQAYGGSGKGQVVVDGSSSVAGLALSFNLSGVQAEPLLAAAIGLDKLTGTGQLNFDLSAHGRSQRDLIGALSGKGAFGFSNGAIKGIDLAAMMKNVQQAFLSAVSGQAQETKFAELSGTFTAANGIITNNDLALQSPVVQVKGSGTVSLPTKSVDYRVEPEASVNSKDYSVAVKIGGPWDHLSYQPDLQAMIEQNAGKLLQGVIGNKTGGSNSPASGLLKGLFGK
jgi:AsmA protein